ncbi:hypothetical protein ACRE_019330 [Hapsidospora chrysogenum ATCC 11550]|uniref:Uncharacterized protein n=1 Tax=Hapsidospora chrysogenum (strain ATCC 11550 / CBS 779.69 / DSM 880 / IAM 14645 / JCM 23072 / IMI 49137) TaxID=857340 RepID=A0A086TD76_HAPC1|nr:hypothetical protein ACRE_019330 [Hapsidospora chrysogenum ATCC 11550]
MTTSQYHHHTGPFAAAAGGTGTGTGTGTGSTGPIITAGHLHHNHHHQQLGAQSQASTAADQHHHRHQHIQQDHAAAPADVLTFTDVSSDISHLQFDPDRQHPNADALGSLGSSSRPVSRSSTGSSQHRQPQPSASAPASAIRKTSPGLAARLKALGFGAASAKKPASPPTPSVHDRVGRLDEHQLRQLDEKHQAASSHPVIVRRGRPWKGAGAILTSRKPDRHLDPSRLQPPGPESITTTTITTTTVAADPHPTTTPPPHSPISSRSASDLDSSPQLPEIRTPEPLAMDTQKYRLPDHTNGNGTKVTLDTRREHIERDTRPPAPDDDDQDVATPPPPPPKETPPADTPPATSGSGDFVPGLGSYFTPGHNRPGSIYTLSRASFANQLAQLTSLQLPDAESLSSRVSAIPTAQLAAKALINAADQIRSWISKASEVISGLDSDDDVEWSAAGGREGLAEVENAIVRFEELINVYVSAIEELQSRKDIADVSAEDLTRAVAQMESIVHEWAKIRATLQSVRAQVEIAMEWEELWNNVLGDIQGEMDELGRLVFEMEERRHKSIAAAASGDSVDIGDLETIVEDTPPQAARIQAQSRLSIPTFPMSPSSPGTPGTPGAPSLSQDDSSLLALFARMQPLRASLDFLPMRLSVFSTRAEKSFPTACDELEMRRAGLDASYKKLEKDAESLRKELGEDRWVIVFRGAGRQAQKMHESVERSLFKLQEAIDAGMHLTNPPSLTKKLESYEAKKTHYGPAIERVLSIIDRGVKDRLTVNGEILRLHTDLETRWASLKEQIRNMDATVEELQVERRSQQLRDSVSSMLSNDRSTVGSGHETPGSSPPSSVIMSSLGVEPYTPGSHKAKNRSSSVPSANRRHSSLPAPAGSASKRAGSSRLSTVPSSSVTTPVHGSKIERPGSTMAHRPKWNASTNTSGIDTGHNFKPLSLTTPSPYSKRSPMTQRSISSVTPGAASGSKLPTFRSPLARATSESPQVDDTPTRTGHSRLSFRERLASPHAQTLPVQKPRLSAQNSTASSTSNRRSSFQPPRAPSALEDTRASRPASSLASTSRRSSLLPQSRTRRESSTGRASPQALSASRLAMRRSDAQAKDARPPWRP